MLDGVDLLLGFWSDGLAGCEMIVAEYDVCYYRLFGRLQYGGIAGPDSGDDMDVRDI